MQAVTLDNGLRVLVTENPTADIIATRIFTRFGSLYHSREQAGLAHLIAAVLPKGTNHLSAQDIAQEVESVGAGLGTDATPDYFLVSLKTVSADFRQLLHLASQLLRSPTFPNPEVDLERNQTLQILRSQREQPLMVAFNQLRQALYQTHPYGVTTVGTEATISQLSREDLVVAHQTYFRPDNMTISIAGRIDTETAIPLIQEVFGDWQSPSTPLPTLDLPLVTLQPRQQITPQATQQAIIVVGYLAAPVQRRQDYGCESTDYATLKLLSTYLGNGLSSRLFVELREKRGLAYEVSALYPTRLDPSYFLVYLGTAPENVTIALDSLHREVERLATVPLSPEALQTAKSKFLGQYALGKQTNAQLAQIFGRYEILGFGADFDRQFQTDIAGVTVDRAQAVAQQYFKTPYLSLVGPATAVASVGTGLFTPVP